MICKFSKDSVKILLISLKHQNLVDFSRIPTAKSIFKKRSQLEESNSWIPKPITVINQCRLLAWKHKYMDSHNAMETQK